MGTVDRPVPYGYALIIGKAYSERLTAVLVREYANASSAQILLGGLTARIAAGKSSSAVLCNQLSGLLRFYSCWHFWEEGNSNH